MKLRNRILFIVIMVMLGVLLTGCSLFPKEESTLAPPLVEPATATISTAEVKLGMIEKALTGTGSFEPTKLVYHQFTQASGRVEEVFFRSGDTVSEGDVLLRLENRGLDREVIKKELELEKKKLALEEAKRTGNQQRIHIAELEKELAQMEYDAAEAELINTELKAKMDGVVVFDGDVKAGDEISEYQILFTVADPTAMRLAFNSPSKQYVNEVSVGMSAEVEFRDKTYKGKVVQTPDTAPTVEDERLQEEYAQQLYIEVAEAPGDITMGEKASISIVLDKKENVVIIPKRGIREALNQTYVQLLEGEGRREKDVEVGIENSTEVEIVQGLEVGEQVILK